MRNFKINFATIVLVASMGLTAPVQAELLVNEWSPIEFVVTQHPDLSCGEGEFFLIQGMRHFKVSTLKKGGVAINLNDVGTLTDLETGEEALWRFNIIDVLPIAGENVVYTYRENRKVIVRGPALSFFLMATFHVTDIGGEFKAYIDDVKITCK